MSIADKWVDRVPTEPGKYVWRYEYTHGFCLITKTHYIFSTEAQAGTVSVSVSNKQAIASRQWLKVD